MTGDRARRIRDLFDRAASLAGDEREQLFVRECAGDDSLRAEVEDLLARSPATGELPVPPLFESAAADAPAADAVDIDGYEVHRLIGAGGMGVVYEGAQLRPRRRVALKVLRGGRYADDLRKRLFLREADALARLVHPGIARIYESGETRDGQLFFSMEMVDGESLEARIRAVSRAALGPAGRDAELRLFRRICDAVLFAHQNAVIHRDLKPSNILLVEEPSSEGGPATTSPKVLDFGLARIAEVGDDPTFVTEPGVIRGTLQYMSPEQARGVPGGVDLRSDIYSLGVILYQMLTGDVPYGVSDVDVPEALRRVCEQEPVPLRRALPGAAWLDAELAAIVGKALEKDPGRRYQSVHALAVDVGRYLDGRPVEARPQSTLYQARKFVSRHRVGVALGTGLLAALLIAVVGTTTGMLRARKAEASARTEARTARATADLLAEILEGADPWQSKGSTTLREVLDRGSEKVRDGLKQQPAVRARLLNVIGKTYSNLGLHADGLPLLEEALASYEELDGEGAPGMVDVLNNLGAARLNAGDIAGAREVLTRAQSIGESVLPEDDERVAYTLNLLGYAALSEGDAETGRRHLRRSVAIRERVFGPEDPKVAASLTTLAQSFQVTADFDTAGALLRRALTILEGAGESAGPKVAVILNNLGTMHYGMDDLDGARDYLERAAAIQESSLGPDHADLARTLSNLGAILIVAGDPAAAIPALERSIVIRTNVFGAENLQVSASLENLAAAAEAIGDLPSARAHLERVIEIVESLQGPAHADLAPILTSYAGILRDLDQTSMADAAEQRAEAIRRASARP